MRCSHHISRHLLLRPRSFQYTDDAHPWLSKIPLETDILVTHCPPVSPPFHLWNNFSRSQTSSTTATSASAVATSSASSGASARACTSLATCTLATAASPSSGTSARKPTSGSCRARRGGRSGILFLMRGGWMLRGWWCMA